jgi:hypothetical protein
MKKGNNKDKTCEKRSDMNQVSYLTALWSAARGNMGFRLSGF